MARKAVEQELNRGIILNVAREMFEAKGYQAVSMRAIAKRLGYSHGSLYYHFKDKAELFYQLVVDDFASLFHRQSQIFHINELSVEEKLRMMMDEFIRFGLKHPFQYEVMFLIQDDQLRKYTRREQSKCFDLFSRVVHAAAEEVAAHDARLFSLPRSLFMSLHGFITYCNRFNQSYEDVQQFADDHIVFLCQNVMNTLKKATA